MLIRPRVMELETLGMMWPAWDTAWVGGLAVAQEWAAVHGHFLPPATAVWEDFPIGVWAKNQPAAARVAVQNAERREYGETAVSGAGELSQSRLDALDAIDPARCPAWEIHWQRAFHLTHAHLRADGTLRQGRAKSSCRAKTSAPGPPPNGPAGTSSCPHSSGS